MPKQISLDRMDEVLGRIRINYTEVVDHEDVYYPARIDWVGKARGEGAEDIIMTSTIIGNPRATPYTPKEIHARINNALGGNVADAFKQLYIDGINEDIEV